MFLPLANLNQKLYLKQWFLPNRAANINFAPHISLQYSGNNPTVYI